MNEMKMATKTNDFAQFSRVKEYCKKHSNQCVNYQENTVRRVFYTTLFLGKP